MTGGRATGGGHDERAAAAPTPREQAAQEATEAPAGTAPSPAEGQPERSEREEQPEPAEAEGRPEAAGPTPRRRRGHRRAVRRGTEQGTDSGLAWEDDDRAWGDRPADEDRLRREVPPHWG